MNGVKQHRCPDDGRTFATAKALAQHRGDSHGSRKTPAASKPRSAQRSGRGGRRTGNARNANISSGVVPAPLSLPPNDGNSVIVSGEDRVLSFVVGSKSTIIKCVEVAASMSPRLATLTKAYRHMRWIKVSMYVTPQATVTTMGGYVAGFIPDAEDRSVTLEQLAASTGSQTKKWYETSAIVLPNILGDFYTHIGVEPRLSSPGNFWVMSDGLPGQNVTVVVTIKWTVRLLGASLDDSTTFVSKFSLVSSRNNYNAQMRDQDGNSKDDTSPLYPSLPPLPPGKTYHFFRVPTFNVEYSEGTGDTGTVQCHFVAYNPVDKKTYYSQNGSAIDQTIWQDGVSVQILVPCGTLMRYTGSGNSSCQAQQPELTSMASGSSGDRLTELTSVLTNLLSSLVSLKQTPKSTSDDWTVLRPPESE